MAFLAQDDKQLQTGQDPNQTGGSAQSAIVGGSAPGATVGGAPVSTAGVGAGGAGGWTNIQAYLGANKGKEQDSANKLNSTVGSQFSQEQSNLNKTSTDTKSAASQQVEQNRIGQDQASQMIEKMGSQYKYPTATPVANDPLAQAQGPNEYDTNRSKFQSALSAQYQGPENYSYGMDAKTQKYGEQISNDDSFKGLMGDIYNQAAGGQLARGGRMLQNQLDNGNEHLTNARTKLMGDYSGLNTGVSSEIESTNKAIEDAKTGLYSNRDGLKSYLQTTGQTKMSDLEKAIADQNATDKGINQEHGNVFWKDSAPDYDTNGFNAKGSARLETLNGEPDWRVRNGVTTSQDVRDQGSFAFNTKEAQEASKQYMQQLEGMRTASGGSWGDFARMMQNQSGGDTTLDRNNYYNDGTLTDWETGIDKTTKGVGDQARGSYNSILDVLGMNEARIDQKDNKKLGRYVMDGGAEDLNRAGKYLYKQGE